MDTFSLRSHKCRNRLKCKSSCHGRSWSHIEIVYITVVVCTCIPEDIFFSKYKYDQPIIRYWLFVSLFILRIQFTEPFPEASVVKFLGLYRWLESPNQCNHKSQWGETTHSRYWYSHFSLSVWINTEKATADNISTNWLAECLRYDNSTNNILWGDDCCADERGARMNSTEETFWSESHLHVQCRYIHMKINGVIVSDQYWKHLFTMELVVIVLILGFSGIVCNNSTRHKM